MMTIPLEDIISDDLMTAGWMMVLDGIQGEKRYFLSKSIRPSKQRASVILVGI